MAQAIAASHPTASRNISPLLFVLCGLVLMLAGSLFYWLEKEPTVLPPTAADEVAAAQAATARALQRTREREARAIAEMERKEAEERALRVLARADGSSEVAAKREREELARRQAEAEKVQRAAAAIDEAWKRFFQPSAHCRDAAAATRIDCVNEYVKAKREFDTRHLARQS